MVRQAGLDDIPALLALGERFHAQSPYAGNVPYQADAFERNLRRFMDQGAFFIAPDAFCGGILSRLYFNDDVLVASELFWFAGEAGHGPGVLRAWQDWTKAQGVLGDHMTVLCDDREGRMRRMMSKRHDYEAVEVSMFRRH